jgi:hypothetical protein
MSHTENPAVGDGRVPRISNCVMALDSSGNRSVCLDSQVRGAAAATLVLIALAGLQRRAARG